jgi:adenylate cyclase
MFGSYVDPGVVEQLVRDPNAIRLGGEKREATVFFCDLAGFTDMSEQVSPEELLVLINRYLEETSDCLLAHGAYIDKYIGDAVMAVFGAPQRLPNHAEAAGRAALAAQEVLTKLNVELSAKYGRTLRMRIGLNSGEMIVGNLGSERKRNYTVLGDAVNLASRLEGANKEFGTAILVGEETTRRIGDALVLRPLTRLRVKGKKRAVEVSELVGVPGQLTPQQEAFLAAYRPAFAAYAARRFAEAAEGFAEAAKVEPNDRMTQALLADALQLAHTPPPSDWEPVLTLESK